MPEPEVDEVRKAALKFPLHPGLSADSWHPRHFGLLSDEVESKPTRFGASPKPKHCGASPSKTETFWGFAR